MRGDYERNDCAVCALRSPSAAERTSLVIRPNVFAIRAPSFAVGELRSSTAAPFGRTATAASSVRVTPVGATRWRGARIADTISTMTTLELRSRTTRPQRRTLAVLVACLAHGAAACTPPNSASADASSDAPNDAASSTTADFHSLGSARVRDGGVRPITPASLANTTLRRPTLRFALPEGADGAMVELCRDRDCMSVIETLRVDGATAQPSADLPASSVVFWRARARARGQEDSPEHVGPTWLFHTPVRDNSAGIETSATPHFDVNGDGFDDVAIGAAYGVSTAGDVAGNVTVYLGSSAGLRTSAAQRLDGEEIQFPFATVASAGDVNGDGYADLLVGAPGTLIDRQPAVGSVSLFLGGRTGVSARPARVLYGVAASQGFGMSVAGAGDVNRDGFADVIVGAPGSGTADVYLGAASGLAASPSIVLRGDGQFGRSVAGGADVNGDGFHDVIVGASDEDVPGIPHAGTARVFLGSEAGIVAIAANTLTGTTFADAFGATVANAGDVNGDGRSDVIVGAPYADPNGTMNAGTASVFLGTVNGVDPRPARRIAGRTVNARLGTSAEGAGDVNADGFHDVVVSAPEENLMNGRVGAVSVYLGAAMGVDAAVARELSSASMVSQFGAALAGLGDINGDGFDDLAVGTHDDSPGGRMNAGSMSIFVGSATGIGADPAVVLEGVRAHDGFGTTVAAHSPAAPTGRRARAGSAVDHAHEFNSRRAAACSITRP